jgi:hypothetical protein
MAWADARARLAVVLGAIAVTAPPAPVAETIKRVYVTPPSKVEDLPCFIIYPPAVDVERRPGDWRVNKYGPVRLRCLVRDADADVAADSLDAFREATIAAFDAEVRLQGDVTLVHSQHIDEAAAFKYGGVDLLGFDCILGIRLDFDVEYGGAPVASAYVPAVTLKAVGGDMDADLDDITTLYTSTGDPIQQWDIIQIDNEQMIVSQVAPAVNVVIFARSYNGVLEAHAGGAAVLRVGSVA